MLRSIFKNKIANFEKILAFGFVERSGIYTYSVNIVDKQFELTINISLDGNIKTKITDIDGKKIFPGYHMNKKHWITIRLDGSVFIEEIYDRVDARYILAKK